MYFCHFVFMQSRIFIINNYKIKISVNSWTCWSVLYFTALNSQFNSSKNHFIIIIICVCECVRVCVSVYAPVPQCKCGVQRTACRSVCSRPPCKSPGWAQALCPANTYNFILLNCSHSNECVWHLIVVAICISLMTNNTKHLFMYLWTICVSFWA